MTVVNGIVVSLLCLLVVATVPLRVSAQGCTNQCPPINFGTPVPSLCEGDLATESSANVVERDYTICHPSPGNFRISDFAGHGRVTVLSNFYVGCNAGRRESGVFAHVAQKYFDQYGNRTTFITSLKGGTTCSQWAGLYQNDALQLFPDSSVVPKEMPLTVLDQEYEMRDDWFTTPFGHPSYVVLDGDLRVRHKFIGPCCGYEGYYDCTADIAVALDTMLSEYIDAILAETGDVDGGSSSSTPPPPTNDEEDNITDNTDGSCTVGDFSEWSSCSVTCGEGIQFRWRTIQPSNTNIGSLDACPTPVETRLCTGSVETCPLDEGCLSDVGETWKVETISSGFDGPRDVAFHPTPGLHLGDYSEGREFHPELGEEAWVINGLNHSVSIVSSLGSPMQTTISRRDRGYYHYMINATALAFNMVANSNRSPDRDSFNYWAVCNDNRNTYLETKEANYFMGPTLYNSDPRNQNTVNRLGEECGPEEPCYFLHADMLHESPACIGIAHDPEVTTAYGNIYWAFDSTGNGITGQLVRFDFQQAHGPGSMDHSVAAIRRYPEIELLRGAPGVHAGMVVHPTRRELYVSVPGANKILVVHADSGAYARTAREEYPIFSSRLPSFEYSIWECAEQRDFAEGIQTPSGLALSPNGEFLYVAERATGKIVVFEVSSAARVAEIETDFQSIGGLSFAPGSKVLHFVDENTNTLNAIKLLSLCTNTLPSRLSESFAEQLTLAEDTVNRQAGQGGFFSLFRNYECTVDPLVPDAAFFDQVHLDTGYASDNPDVQSMAGMDASAALLANRTDCGSTSELNFDQLLLGGYYCHQCLPVDDGAECDAGGVCTNVQWLGYYCDNEFFVVFDEETSQVVLTTANKTIIDSDDLVLRLGVTYRFIVQMGDEPLCVHSSPDKSSMPIALPGNEAGCVARGPILLAAGNSLPVNLFLRTTQGVIKNLVVEGGSTTMPDSGPSEEDDKPNIGLIMGVVIGGLALLAIVGGIAVYVAKNNKGKEGGVEEAREPQNV